MNEEFREFGWDDEINAENSPFTVIPDGNYRFTVKSFERARHPGSEKIPACNMAKVTFTIHAAEGDVEITDNFFLCNKFEWKLSALFLSTGLKKHGEPLRMAWNQLYGKSGVCSVYIDTYKNKYGNEGKSNKIKKFFAYDEQPTNIVQPAPPQNFAQPSYSQQQYSQPTYTAPTQGGWTPGAF